MFRNRTFNLILCYRRKSFYIMWSAVNMKAKCGPLLIFELFSREIWWKTEAQSDDFSSHGNILNGLLGLIDGLVGLDIAAISAVSLRFCPLILRNRLRITLVVITGHYAKGVTCEVNCSWPLTSGQIQRSQYPASQKNWHNLFVYLFLLLASYLRYSPDLLIIHMCRISAQAIAVYEQLLTHKVTFKYPQLSLALYLGH